MPGLQHVSECMDLSTTLLSVSKKHPLTLSFLFKGPPDWPEVRQAGV